MSRSLKKGPFTEAKLVEKVQRAKATNNRAPIKTWSRASTITPEMVGVTFAVHNGKVFNSVYVEENMVGHKLGEFSATRKFIVHGGKMAKEQGKETTPAAAAKPAAKPAAKK